MTSAPHPPGGPDLDVLADLSVHLLPSAQERSTRAHVDGCAECKTVLQALERVGSELRWLPPLHMPSDVAARIDAALAAEGKVVSIETLRVRRRKRQQMLGIAAAGVIVFGGGGVLVSQLGGDSPSVDLSADAGQDDEPAEAVEPPDFDEDSLPGAVSDLVTGGEADEPPRLEGTPAPADCVDSVQLASVDELIGVIEIRYGGRNRDAVFFTTADPGLARVIVVDDCSMENPQVIDTVEGQV